MTTKKEFLGVHGDGGLQLETTLEEVDRILYRDSLEEILTIVGIAEDREQFTADEMNLVLLALKQRISLGFSNGCPRPEKAVIGFLSKLEVKPQDPEELSEAILESGRGDAQCSFLYQKILKYANRTLRSELQLLKPTEVIDGQEEHNLPIERTEHNLVAGLAYDPVYLNILLPLKKFIVTGEDMQKNYDQAIQYVVQSASTATSITQLIEMTKIFLNKETTD